MIDAPASAVTRKLPQFRDWLIERGASMLEPTSEWEVLRFEDADGVSIIYRNSRGRATATGNAAKAWKIFSSGGGAWTAGVKRGRQKMTPKVRALLKRDGNLCFFCQQPMEPFTETVEHIVPIAHGGPNHMSNLALAHSKCNADSGHDDAMTKIRKHVESVLANLTTASATE